MDKQFGGMYMPELLIAPLEQLKEAWRGRSPSFQKRLDEILATYAGRPTPLTEAKRFAASIEGPRLLLKREDLLHTGAHKLNNALGQCLLAREMGKTRIIAETGAGQHGVATAAACAYLGLDCVVYMGKIDMDRQAPNVSKMRLLGAKVISVEQGSMTLKDAVNEALRDYASTYETTHYCLGSALGPDPYPEMVAAFQTVIGKEVQEECLSRFGKHPDLIIACVGGGSNAIGIFSPFISDPKVQLIGVEAAGAARFQGGSPGVLHGCYTYLLQDAHGQVEKTHSISAGLDYPAVGPQHADLFLSGRASYTSVNDEEALLGFKLLSEKEGIIPALESSHALGYLAKAGKRLPKEMLVVLNLSGRGDKDIPQLMQRGIL